MKGINYEKERGRWRARLQFGGHRYYLGYYKTEEKAARAREGFEDDIVRRFNEGYGKIGHAERL
jgi:hypothetical protein